MNVLWAERKTTSFKYNSLTRLHLPHQNLILSIYTHHVLLVHSRTLAGCSGARLHTTVHSRPHFTALPVGSDRTVHFRACARGIPMIAYAALPAAPSVARCTPPPLSPVPRNPPPSWEPSRGRNGVSPPGAVLRFVCARASTRARVHWRDARLNRALRGERRVVVRRCGQRLGGEVDGAWNDDRVGRRGDARVDRGDTRVVVHRARRLGPAHGAGAVAPATARMWRSVSALWVQRA